MHGAISHDKNKDTLWIECQWSPVIIVKLPAETSDLINQSNSNSDSSWSQSNIQHISLLYCYWMALGKLDSAQALSTNTC